MFAWIKIIPLVLQSIKLGLQILRDERLKDAGRKEVELENSKKTVMTLIRFQDVDEEIHSLDPDTVFDRLRNKNSAGRRRSTANNDADRNR